MKGKLLLAITAPVAITGIFFVTKIFAQTPPPLDITVSPPVIELSGNPGETISSKIRIHNNSNQSVLYSITPVKLNASNDTTTYSVTKNFTPDDAASWVKLTATPSAHAKEWIDIPYTVSIPPTASFGYYFALDISDAGQDNAITNGARTEGHVLVINLLTVHKPGIIATATLTGFQSESTINEFLPVKFLTTINNSGNIHLKPRGNIFISDASNKDLDVLEVNSTISSILPNTHRQFESIWKNGFAVLDQNGKLQFNWNRLTDFRLGRYTAKVLVVYDDGTRDVPLTATTSFWIIPYHAIFYLFTGIIIFIVLINLLLRYLVHKEIKKLASSENVK